MNTRVALSLLPDGERNDIWQHPVAISSPSEWTGTPQTIAKTNLSSRRFSQVFYHGGKVAVFFYQSVCLSVCLQQGLTGAQDGLELAVWPRMTENFWPSCSSLLSTGIPGTLHHIRLEVCISVPFKRYKGVCAAMQSRVMCPSENMYVMGMS